jgi:hypothetical protein
LQYGLSAAAFTTSKVRENKQKHGKTTAVILFSPQNTPVKFSLSIKTVTNFFSVNASIITVLRTVPLM